jgi:hypothetical protein
MRFLASQKRSRRRFIYERFQPICLEKAHEYCVLHIERSRRLSQIQWMLASFPKSSTSFAVAVADPVR